MSKKKIYKNNKGFTLIEIMIVICIISTLMAIVIPSFQHSRDQAKLASCQENIKNMATAVEMYAMDNLQVPPTTTDGLPKLVSSGYIKAVPLEPVAGNVYTYEGPAPGSGVKNYTIMCGTPTDQFHGTVGVPPGYPYYTPEAGNATGIGI